MFTSLSLGAASLFPGGDPDTFGHLAAGRQISELGYVPDVDSFSHFRPDPAAWYNYEWLSALLMFQLYTLWGWNALVVAKAAIAALAGALLVLRTDRQHGRVGAALCSALLLCALPALRFQLTVRPHVFGFVLGAFYLLLLPWIARLGAGDRRRWPAVCGLGLLHALWVNLHGSHLLGLSMTAAYAVSHLRSPDARRSLLALLGLQLAASCVSPFGPGILIDALDHVADPAYRELVSEWGPWNPDRHPLWIGLTLYAVYALGVLATLGLRRAGAAGMADVLVLLMLGVMGLRSIRFAGELLLLGAPILAGGLSGLLSERSRRMAPAGAALLALGAALAGPLTWRELPPATGIGLGVREHGLPGSSAWLLNRHRPAARVFAAAEDGWYLTFAMPRVKVLFDGRLPFYGPAHVHAMRMAFARPEALLALLEQSKTDSALLQHSAREHHAALFTLLRERAWSLVHVERHHALLMRNASQLALHALVPGYDASRLLRDDDLRQDALAEAKALGPHESARAYASWVRAIDDLAPLSREAGRAGLRPPKDETERRAAARAAKALRALAAEVKELPLLYLQAAMAQVAACQLEAAEESLECAEDEGETRASALLRLEVALRRGEQARVDAEVDRALADPRLADDEWLLALRELLRDPPHCHT